MNPAGGLAQFWAQGDAISHLVAYALLLMSLLSWYFILAKGKSAWRIRKGAAVLDHFWRATNMATAIAELQDADPEQIYAPMAAAGVQAAGAKPPTTLDAASRQGERLTRALRREINRATARLESGLTILASIGATAPFVGLLGTVWGIYHALAAVSASGTVQIDKVAGPVGEALIMTALGLAVAIPAVLAYNGFTRLNRITLAELDAFAHDLHAHLGHAGQTR